MRPTIATSLKLPAELSRQSSTKTRAGTGPEQPRSMADAILSPEAYADLEYLEAFLWDSQDPLASEWLGFLLEGLWVLTRQSGMGRPLSHGLRERIISRGRGGYLILSHFILSSST